MLAATATAAAEPDRGWGGPIAILVAVLIYRAIVWVKEWRTGKVNFSSPTPARGGVIDRTPQVNEVSDTDDTCGDTDPWYGRIVEIGGHRMRTVGHILRTGSSPPPDVDDDEGGGEVYDLDLDEPETLAEYVARLDGEGMAYAKIVRAAMQHYRVSESTAKRAIRDSRR